MLSRGDLARSVSYPYGGEIAVNKVDLDFNRDDNIDYSDIPDLSDVPLGPMFEFVPRCDGNDDARLRQMLDVPPTERC